MLPPTSISPWWIGLAGVALGFLLGEGARYARYRWDIWRDKRMIRTELQTILSQLPQKKDILNQAIAHFSNKQFMPTRSVRFITTGYRATLENLYPHLSLIERNCLHIIYEHLRIVDEHMDELEETFIGAVKDKIIPDPVKVYAERLQQLLEALNVVDKLARAYLDNKPIDVFGIV